MANCGQTQFGVHFNPDREAVQRRPNTAQKRQNIRGSPTVPSCAAEM